MVNDLVSAPQNRQTRTHFIFYIKTNGLLRGARAPEGSVGGIYYSPSQSLKRKLAQSWRWSALVPLVGRALWASQSTVSRNVAAHGTNWVPMFRISCSCLLLTCNTHTHTAQICLIHPLTLSLLSRGRRSLFKLLLLWAHTVETVEISSVIHFIVSGFKTTDVCSLSIVNRQEWFKCRNDRSLWDPCYTIIVEIIPSFHILCMLDHFVLNTSFFFKEQTTLVSRTVFDCLWLSHPRFVATKVIQHSLQSSHARPHRFPSHGPNTARRTENGQTSHSFKDGIPSRTKQEMLQECVTITASHTSRVSEWRLII